MSFLGVAGGFAAGYVLYKGHSGLQKQLKGGKNIMAKKKKRKRKTRK